MNTKNINSFNINSEKINLPYLFLEEDIVTSFSNKIESKYSFKSSIWSFFNFNNICIKWRSYWNLLLNHNFDDVPSSKIYSYNSPFSHGWIVFDKKYTQKNIKFSIVIYSDSIEKIENEIRELKKYLEVWWQIIKNEINNQLQLNVILEDQWFSVWRIKTTWTEINISLVSFDPFWKNINSNTIFNENITSWNFSWSINLSKTSISWFVENIIYIKNLTWVINKINISISSYEIEINEIINENDTIVIDGINSQVFINWIDTDFFWKIPELEINIPHEVLINFSWGWSVWVFDFYTTYINNQI